MKRNILIHISLVFLMISCQNANISQQETSSNIESDNQIEDKIFYLEFIHPENSIEYVNSIKLIKKELFENGYIAGKDLEKGIQGIRKIDSDEYITKQDIDTYHQKIHRFKDFSKCDPNKGDIEKIVITLNKPIYDSIPNFNFHSYKKLNQEDWQSVSNPGNFRFENKDTISEDELANWMVEHITLLTFK